MTPPILSILIPTIERRREKLKRLQDLLIDQFQKLGLTFRFECAPEHASERHAFRSTTPARAKRAASRGGGVCQLRLLGEGALKQTPQNLDDHWMTRVVFGSTTQSVEISTYCTRIWDHTTNAYSVGSKRNALIGQAIGKYVVFIDDDDIIRSHYISSILAATSQDPDVIGIKAEVYRPNTPNLITTFDRFPFDTRIVGTSQESLPNHLCAWRRSLCLPYNDIAIGEDANWARRMNVAHPHASIACVDSVIYEYHWDPNDSVQNMRPPPTYLRKPGPG